MTYFDGTTMQNVVVDSGDFSFNYAGVYNQFIGLSFDTTMLTTAEQAIFLQLNPQISANGVLTSNSINQDLSFLLVVTLREGAFDSNGRPINSTSGFSIPITFNNSVEFSVGGLVEGLSYLSGEDNVNPITGQDIGHVFTDINKVVSNTMDLGASTTRLFDATVSGLASPFSTGNIFNLIGGNGEDLFGDSFSGLTLNVWNGSNFVNYAMANPVTRNAHGAVITSTTSVSGIITIDIARVGNSVVFIDMIINYSVNATTHYRMDLEFADYDMIKNYHFTIVADIYLQTNYPHLNGIETLTRNSSINLNQSYINPLPRIQILQDTFNYVGAGAGNYMAVTTENGVQTLFYVFAGNGLGSYIKQSIEFVLNFNGTQFLLEAINNPTVIAITNFNADTNFFQYSLISAGTAITSHQAVVGTFPRVSGMAYANSNIEITADAMTANLAVRVQLFNGVFVDYNIQVVPNILRETITVINNSTGAPITESNPLVIRARTTFNIHEHIRVQNGNINNLAVIYNNVATPLYIVSGNNEISVDIFTRIANSSQLIFEDIVGDTLVSFDIFGQNFIGGDAPVRLFIRVIANFTINVNASEFGAGREYDLFTTEAFVHVGQGNGNYNSNGVFVGENLGAYIRNTNALFTIGPDAAAAINTTFEVADVHVLTPFPFGWDFDSTAGTLTVHNTSARLRFDIRITKTFNNGLVLTTILSVNFVPNAIAEAVYSNNTFQQLTAPAVIDNSDVNNIQIDDIQFNVRDFLTIRDFEGNILVNHEFTGNGVATNGYFETSYLFTDADGSNPRTTTAGGHMLNTSNGVFSLLPVNAATNIYLTVIITWLETFQGSGLLPASASFGFTYNIRLMPNLNNLSVAYFDTANNVMNVFSGTTLQLNFDNSPSIPSGAMRLMQQDVNFINITANNRNIYGELMPVNIVLQEQTTDLFRVFFDGSNYFITFTSTASAMQLITIPLFLDLTGVAFGVVSSTAGLFNNGTVLRIAIHPSITGFSLRSEFMPHQTQSNPLVIDYNNPTFQFVGFGQGSYNFNAQTGNYEFVGAGFGYYDVIVTNQRFTYVGPSMGDYIFNQYNVYEYIGIGFGDFVMLANNQLD